MFTFNNLIVIAIYVYLVMYVLKDTTHKVLATIVALYLLTNNVAGFANWTGFRFSFNNIVVIAVYVYLLMYVLKDTTHKLLATIVLWLVLRITNDVAGFTGDVDDTNVANDTVTDDGAKPGRKIDAPTLNTGPYDGLCLKTGNTDSWMKSPDETALVPNDRLYTYLSSQGPIKMRLSDQAALRGPPVDGVPGSAEKMFMWANNVTSPLCCPSNFSTSTGCVCSTKNQRDFIASRGMMDVDPNNDVSTDEVEV